MVVVSLLNAVNQLSGAEGLDPAIQAKVDAGLREAQAMATNPVIVNAVKAHNAAVPEASSVMTQEKWRRLSLKDPFVRAFTENESAKALKKNVSDMVSEAFVSGAEGMKVAFLSKTTNWNHKGKPKHDEPMAGKTWQGPLELDESTGIRQIQVAVPVLDGGKPIGSLVLGLSISKLSGSPQK
jgi:hypothetical protein